MGASKIAQRVVARFLSMSKEHDSPEALKKYLHDHPNADRSKHHVKKPSDGKKPGGGKDMSTQKGFEPLKGLSPAEQKETIQKALLNLDTEKDQAKGKDDKTPAKDRSQQKGFEVLKGLSPEAQRKLIQKALGK